ncbi:MAG: hypothetical protein OEY56_09745, partial [Cyclobacteriaceae bacterium]|nr:hypothetical protein [Cyclobacteriaceae bacterium]
YNRHFRAYNADFTTSRRCCTGVERDCTTCMDTWEHYSWIMIQLKKHLSSKEDFANWLVVMYSFYLINRLVPDVISDTLLRTLHRYSNTAKLV